MDTENSTSSPRAIGRKPPALERPLVEALTRATSVKMRRGQERQALTNSSACVHSKHVDRV